MKRNLVDLGEKTDQLFCRTTTPPSTTHTMQYQSHESASSRLLLFPLVCMSLVFLLSVRTSVAQDIDTQYNALKALYEATDGDNWTNNSGWDTTLTNPTVAELDDFFGVEVHSRYLVTWIGLPNNNLRGSIPAELGNISNLSWLDLANNALSGPIPPEFSKLSNVFFLSLSDNGLSGSIPPGLGQLAEVTDLRLGGNDLTGIIPSEMGNLASLGLLDIQGNDFFGKLPLTMVNLSELNYLNFGGQELCAPETPEFQAWLAGVGTVYGETCNALKNIPSHTGARIACTAGKAAEFECKSIDLLSHLSRRDIGAVSGILVNDIWGWTDPETNQEYALVGKENSVAIVDVTDQLNPVYLGSLHSHDPDAVAIWRDMKVYRNHMFVVADAQGHENGMQIFDLTQLRGVDRASLPATFIETANYQEIGSAHNVFVHEETGYAYLTGSKGGRGRCGVGLHIVSVQDPMNPTFAGCHHEPQIGRSFSPGYVHDVQCVIYRGPDATYHGREICVAPGEMAINIVDVTDKSNTVSVAVMTYPLVAYSHQGWFTDDHRYFIANDELDEANFRDSFRGTRTLFWDLNDLDDPVLLTEYFSPEKTVDHNLYVLENYAYLSNYESGLRILNIEDVANPVEIAYFDTDPVSNRVAFEYGVWSSYPYFKSGIVVVSSMEQGLFVLQPTTLSITASEKDEQVPEAFAVRGNHPNPFNPSTRILLDLPESAEVTIDVIDLLGRKMFTLNAGTVQAGKNKTVLLDTGRLASGTYLYQVIARSASNIQTGTGRMVLMK
ncbi:MAG: choice-of-anchor B family protein [Rhodothermaceae bacterium]|nr:choice-of-anchor B family protein [Rhodothermaceae bacterium]